MGDRCAEIVLFFSVSNTQGERGGKEERRGEEEEEEEEEGEGPDCSHYSGFFTCLRCGSLLGVRRL